LRHNRGFAAIHTLLFAALITPVAWDFVHELAPVVAIPAAAALTLLVAFLTAHGRLGGGDGDA